MTTTPASPGQPSSGDVYITGETLSADLPGHPRARRRNRPDGLLASSPAWIRRSPGWTERRTTGAPARHAAAMTIPPAGVRSSSRARRRRPIFPAPHAARCSATRVAPPTSGEMGSSRSSVPISPMGPKSPARATACRSESARGRESLARSRGLRARRGRLPSSAEPKE